MAKTSTKDNKSIKSKERVNKFGEVFTPENIVKDMLDMDGVRECSYSLDKTFLEPSCGTGNFLVEIIARKLSYLDKIEKDDVDKWAMSMLQAVSTIYGVDIQGDNVEESRERMFDIIRDKYKAVYEVDMPDDLERCVNMILNHNIVCGNFLTEKYVKDTVNPDHYMQELVDAGYEPTSERSLEFFNHEDFNGDSDEKATLLVIEWNYDFDNHTILPKAYTFQQIKDDGSTPTWECVSPVKYNHLFEAEMPAEDDGFDML